MKTTLLRDKDHIDEKIQSMHFDAGKWILEINGKPVEFPVMLSWPDGFSADAWQRRMIVNAETDEEAMEKQKRGEKLPVIAISFEDGTGSYSIKNRL